MKDLTKKYMDELKGAKNYDFLEALVKNAEKYGWIENEELRELLFFSIDLNQAALAYIEAQKNGTSVMEEIKTGIYSKMPSTELVRMFERNSKQRRIK